MTNCLSLSLIAISPGTHYYTREIDREVLFVCFRAFFISFSLLRWHNIFPSYEYGGEKLIGRKYTRNGDNLIEPNIQELVEK